MDNDKTKRAEADDAADDRRGQVARMPFARATSTLGRPISLDRLNALAAPYGNKTVGQRFFGPAWIGDDGIPHLVFIAHNLDSVKRLRIAGACAAIAWRWNGSPSMMFSLTLVMRDGTARPHVRWMRCSADPVVETLRQHGRFRLIVALPDGQHAGWMEAEMFTGTDENSLPSLAATESLWEFPTPGIPRSNVQARFNPFRLDNERETDDETAEIALWPEPSSDVWSELAYEGPWRDDLQHQDRARAVWGRQALRNRGRAAGFVQAILERQAHDGIPPLVDAQGIWLQADSVQARVTTLVNRAPLIGQWLGAMVGPQPNAQAAYHACLAVINDPYALFCVLDKLWAILSDAGDLLLAEASSNLLDAAFLDASITRSGSHRPWIANTLDYGLEIKASPIDLDAPLSDIRELWRNGLETMDLLDAGLRLAPHDYPVPMREICESLRKVSLEGSYDEAEALIQTILQEAQAARQWSIPWGARVEVAFGPFTSVRIFETNGEFSCHFLDSAERYHHVAIGLAASPPRAASRHFIRSLDDGSDPDWNTDAELSLQLIAAAIVRDFLVVEEREALFGTRPMRRRIRGRDVRTVIYLPRVRYTTPHIAVGGHIGDETSSHRPRHAVAPHLRRAGNASPAQRFLAKKYGVQIPEGFTFVRPHNRGENSDNVQAAIYRSRSASRMIFDEVSTTPAGTRPAWFDFEKDCLQLLKQRGMQVVHQAANRDGDGGIDLYAVDPLGQSWIVQCKCWATHRKVGPDILRELQGAIVLADKDASSQSRGMLITTSSFSPGSIAAAATLDVELIDGEQFANFMKAPAASS